MVISIVADATGIVIVESVPWVRTHGYRQASLCDEEVESGLVRPEFEGLLFGRDECGAGFGEDVFVGDAVPVGVLAMALGADVEEAGDRVFIA
ncbi:MAG: hypothetical protein AB7V18_17510 [Pyrinomonadaceae bacterium]